MMMNIAGKDWLKSHKRKGLLFTFVIRFNLRLRDIALSFEFDISFQIDILSERIFLCCVGVSVYIPHNLMARSYLKRLGRE